MRKAHYQNEESRTRQRSEAFDGFIIIKPGFLSLGDEVYKELIDSGFKIISMREKTLTRAESEAIYEMHRGKMFFDELVGYMSGGESVGIVVKSPYDGHDEAIDAVNEIKQRFREYSIDMTRNVLHSSDSHENVIRESAIYFR